MAKKAHIRTREDVPRKDDSEQEFETQASIEDDSRKDAVKKWADGIVEAAMGTVSEVVDSIREKTDDLSKRQLAARDERDKSSLRPVFREMLFAPADMTSAHFYSGFVMPTIIHIVEKDKKHAESRVCDHSLGHLSDENGITVLNVYPQHIDDLNVTFFPNTEQSIYYVDPVRKDLYIDISEYFQQLKLARVNELEQLAYSLGATHFEILFKTDTIELENAKKKAILGAKKGKKKLFEVNAEHDENEIKKESVEVAKALDLGGHSDPQIPELVYFRDNADIQSLINMRMNSKNSLKKKECSIKYSYKHGIKESDAAKLEGAIGNMGGGSAGVSFKNEMLTENHTTLIYKIEF